VKKYYIYIIKNNHNMAQTKKVTLRIIAKQIDEQGKFKCTQEFNMSIDEETLLYSATSDIEDTCKEMIKRYTEKLKTVYTESGITEPADTYEYYSHAPVFLEPISLGDADETFNYIVG